MTERKHEETMQAVRSFNAAQQEELELSDEIETDAGVLALDEALRPGAGLAGARLREGSLAGRDLSGADLSGADLENADLSGANLRGAALRGANLWGTTLRGAQLQGAVLTEANLHLAVLRGAAFDRSTRWPEGFDPERRGAVRAD